MGLILSIIFAAVLRGLPVYFMMGIVYILHYVCFTILHIMLKADIKEYDVENDSFRVKNLVAIIVQSGLMMIFVKSSFSFSWYILIIPVILDVISIPFLYKWFYNWKKAIVYSVLYSFYNNKTAIIIATGLLLAREITIPITIAILFIFGIINSIVSKVLK